MKQYKIILSNNRLYKEVELLPDVKNIKVGTTRNCEARLSKELFFCDFELNFTNNNNSWEISCGDDVYVTDNGIMKYSSLTLKHGDKIWVKYHQSNQEVLCCSFTFDFESERKDYKRGIDISTISSITIGNKSADIVVVDELLSVGNVGINKMGERYEIIDNETRFGVYLNGSKIEKKSELKDMDFIDIGSYSFYFKSGVLYTSIEKEIHTKNLKVTETIESKTKMEFPKYYRNSREKLKISDESVNIDNPTPKKDNNKKSILFTLIPSFSSLLITIVMRGIIGGGGTFVIYSVCTMSIGITMSIANYISDNRKAKRDAIEREKEYLKYISEKEKLIERLREEELNTRRYMDESLAEDINEVESFSKRIYEKDINDEDFLRIYLGKGKVLATNKTEYSKKEFIDYSDKISLLPEELENKYRYIEDAPITIDMCGVSGVGIVADQYNQYQISKNIVLDMAIRHYCNDVKIYFILNEEEAEQYSWIRWLKHIHDDKLDIRNIAYDDESKATILENLYVRLSMREAEARNNNNTMHIPYTIVFVKDINSVRMHPVSKYIEKAQEYGFTFIFFSEYKELIPKGCSKQICIENNGIGYLADTSDFDKLIQFRFEEVSDDVASDTVSKLGAITVDEVSLESELTKNISLFELLNIMAVDDIDLKKKWNDSKVYKSIAVPLGVKKKKELVNLDISDKGKAHGPHGLVAGTTGSGKSEILQTYVLSIATHFHPYDVSFVIIDFKGGGMANQFKDLPHLIGAITNIDGREINRSLLSIKAELVRRQEMFSKASVNHINDYIQLFKKGEVEQPLPHLIMIVDEFAELKAEHPDFMKEIISAARIGRTLGVHLILATQKPSGVVDGQIWSNSKFKLCLKVQSKEDSNEVIKSPLAAEIKEPGRAYFQVGNNEIFELFQSAYSGAKAIEDENKTPFSIYELNLWGKKSQVYTNKKKSSEDSSQTQLDAVVEYIHNYCENNDIKKLPGICLPSLKDFIYMNEINQPSVSVEKGIEVAIGMFDDPEQQRQEEIVLNVSQGNTYIVGAAQSGKTTLLQTIIYGLMSRYTPDEVNIYIIDCGTMSLKIFEKANHVGGVVINSEEEKAKNLFRMLTKTVSSRKNKFAQKGLGTYSAYMEAGFRDLPQIVVIIDNMAAFKEYFSKYDDSFMLLIREGQSVGVNFIVTGNQTNSLAMRALSNFSVRFALYCNERGDYSNLFDRCRMEPKETAGRGLCCIDKRILEFHTALAFEGEKEIDRVNNMKKFIERNVEMYKNVYAKEIPEVPAILKFDEFYEKHRDIFKNKYSIPYGISYESVEYLMLDLLGIGVMAVSGGSQMGKTNFLKIILKTLMVTMFDNITNVYIVDNDERQLEEFLNKPIVKDYAVEMERFTSIIDKVYATYLERKIKLSQNKGSKKYLFDDEPLELILLDNWEIVIDLAKNKEVAAKLLEICKEGKKYKIAIIFGNVDNAKISTISGTDIQKFINENRKFIIFEDAEKIKITEVTLKNLKEAGKQIEPGDGFDTINGKFEKIKTIWIE